MSQVYRTEIGRNPQNNRICLGLADIDIEINRQCTCFSDYIEYWKEQKIRDMKRKNTVIILHKTYHCVKCCTSDTCILAVCIVTY